jgi:hypothetical protein
VGPVTPDPDPDRPRYRVLARPWYDDEPGPDVSPHPDGTEHGPGACGVACAAGHELEVYRVDDAWRAAAGTRYWEPLGVTQCGVVGPLDAWLVRDTVIAWLRLRAQPRETYVGHEHVDVYLRVTS